jgi:ectoine hydroxylase-related dioxygenase (phytanoyl-CoA dioxygenase family)
MVSLPPASAAPGSTLLQHQRSAELQWVPVDPVGRESTLEFVAGSHRGPWLMPRSFMDAQARWFPEGSLAGWELEPGDAVCEILPAGAPMEHALFPVLWP